MKDIIKFINESNKSKGVWNKDNDGILLDVKSLDPSYIGYAHIFYIKHRKTDKIESYGVDIYDKLDGKELKSKLFYDEENAKEFAEEQIIKYNESATKKAKWFIDKDNNATVLDVKSIGVKNGFAWILYMSNKLTKSRTSYYEVEIFDKKGGNKIKWFRRGSETAAKNSCVKEILKYNSEKTSKPKKEMGEKKWKITYEQGTPMGTDSHKTYTTIVNAKTRKGAEGIYNREIKRSSDSLYYTILYNIEEYK